MTICPYCRKALTAIWSIDFRRIIDCPHCGRPLVVIPEMRWLVTAALCTCGVGDDKPPEQHDLGCAINEGVVSE